MPVNKVVYGGETLIDLTSDTAAASNVLSGRTFHRKNGLKTTGTMPNNGTVDYVIYDKEDYLEVAKGYHTGNGGVYLDDDSYNALIPENIKSGVTILGVTGTVEAGATVYSGTNDPDPSVGSNGDIYIKIK